MPYLLFLKKHQNFKLSSAAYYRWCFKNLIGTNWDVRPKKDNAVAQLVECQNGDGRVTRSRLTGGTAFCP